MDHGGGSGDREYIHVRILVCIAVFFRGIRIRIVILVGIHIAIAAVDSISICAGEVTGRPMAVLPHHSESNDDTSNRPFSSLSGTIFTRLYCRLQYDSPSSSPAQAYVLLAISFSSPNLHSVDNRFPRMPIELLRYKGFETKETIYTEPIRTPSQPKSKSFVAQLYKASWKNPVIAREFLVISWGHRLVGLPCRGRCQVAGLNGLRYAFSYVALFLFFENF